METNSFSLIQYLLSDQDSLADCVKGEFPSIDMIKRRLFLLQREQEGKHIPDQYYRSALETHWRDISSKGELLRIGLYRLAEEYMELNGVRIYIKPSMQGAWQELITFIPPLILQMALLHFKQPLLSLRPNDIKEYFCKYILPNTRYTAMPYPRITQLEAYMEQEGGLHDLHIHLNGSTETDSVWQDLLDTPDLAYKSLGETKRNPLVLEQVEQESYMRDPKEMLQLLRYAKRIRQLLFSIILNTKQRPEHLNKGDIFAAIFLDWNSKSSEKLLIRSSAKGSPFSDLLGTDNECAKYPPIAVEGLMYIVLFHDMISQKREEVSNLFHFYLLILGQVHRFLVQQKHQYGFLQFQKITLNNFRELSEKSYFKRFLQLHGNELRNLRFLEGRFSPKSSPNKNERLIKAIESGWKGLLNHLPEGQTQPELKLIAHFIKMRDDGRSDMIRHKSLRCELWQKARVLANQKNDRPKLMKNVVGIDAASSELDAPPEVFAPIFRYLRRNGFNHFTYHAGEDYYHLIGGLRAIYEAVEFCELSSGDRIGHATAAGIDPRIWLDCVGPNFSMQQGQYLDDLIFTYVLIFSQGNVGLDHKIPALESKIRELSYQIYRKDYPIVVLVSAWRLRKYCPILLFAGREDCAKLKCTFDEEEWEAIQRELMGHLRNDDSIRLVEMMNNARVQVLRLYHEKDSRERYKRVVNISSSEIYNADELSALQLFVLDFLHKREIVIETLPSSNLRISHYKSFDDYHLWNWIRWEEQGESIPPIVVGTDDPGIFVTNIYNEYANIYCNLVYNKNLSHSEAIKIVKKLNKNARSYRFN